MKKLLVCALALAGCEATPEPGVPPPPDPMMMMPPAGTGPFFHEHLEPLLQAHCQSCHSAGGIAPFTLESYEDAQRWGVALASAVEDRVMPPWGAAETAECQPRFPFADDLRLDDEDIKTFGDWVRAGMQRGDPAKAPPPRSRATGDALPRVDRDLLPMGSFTTEGPRDQFRCFVLDPGLAEDTFVSGVRLKVDNPKVAHHAIAFLDPARQSLGRMGPDGAYDCFGGPGIQDTALLYAWAPGTQPALTGARAAYQIPAGALIVLQMHYHPLATGPEVDRTGLELMFAQGRPEYTLQVLLIGNFDRPFGGGDGLLPGDGDLGGAEFRIPAGARGHVERMQFTLPTTLGNGAPIPDLKVVNVGTHMHYVGTGMRWSIAHAAPKNGEPAEECMVETPRWNFQWQRGYSYDAAIEQAPEWRADDRMLLRCEYDNSMANPFVAAALREQGLSAPRDVLLGEETLDEMCLAALVVAYPMPVR